MGFRTAAELELRQLSVGGSLWERRTGCQADRKSVCPHVKQPLDEVCAGR